MKVAFVIPSLTNNGPNVFTKILIESLIQYSFFNHSDIVVFYFNETEGAELVFPCKTKKLDFFKKFNFSTFDIIHTTMFKADLYSALRLAGKNKLVVISGIHNEIPSDLRFLYGHFKAWVLEKVWLKSLSKISNLVVSSPYMKHFYETKCNIDAVYEIIPYGIKKRESEYAELAEENNFLNQLQRKYTVIGACGLVIKRKSFKTLLDFIKQNDDFAVVIIGDGPEADNLRELAKVNNLSERFFILGFKDNSVSYYKHFDIFALTSFSEGFGLAMLDALSFNIPLVCSNLPIYKGFFDSNSVGLFEPGDVDSLSNSIMHVTKNKSYFSESSKELFETNFQDYFMAKKHFNLYSQCINNNNT
ncbi:MAG: glycosyltransferase involved in cell wall biosynthesis [bacterium]|jgi:glycosyltransferase involved in cell wall biosynthesis